MTSILVVDDRPTDRQLLVTLLGYMGYQVLEAEDGREALAIARVESLDLMIADVLMPTMDGLELVRQLRADPATASIRVIFCTASYHLEDVETLAAQSGVTHILSKPIEPEIALKVIGAALELPPPSIPAIVADTFHQEHLKALANEASRLSSQIRQMAPRLAALIELGHQLASEHDPLYLLQIFCHTARDIIGSKYAAVAILNEDGQTIRYFLTSGMSDEEALRIGSLPQGKGLLHRLLVENGPVRVDDIRTHPQSVGFPPRHPPMKSFLGVPIISPVRRYGSFYLTDKPGSGGFNAEDEQIVVTLAAQVAVSYENARRYDDLQREMAKRMETETLLRQSEVRFRALTENSTDGIALEDANGRVTYITPAFTRITGYTLEDMQTLSSADIYHPGDMAAVERRRDGLRQPGAIVTAEHRLRHKNGSWCWLEITSHNLLDEAGVNGIVANVRDITQRKEAESELSALYGATSSLFNADSLASLGHQIAQAIITEFRQSDCGVILVDKHRTALVRLPREGEFRIAPDVPLYLDGPGLVPEAIRTGEVVYSPDVTADPQYITGEARTRSELVIPLRNATGVTGALDLQSPHLDAFNQRDRRILAAFAGRASAAIEIMRLYDELQQHAADLEQHVSRRTVELQQAKDHVEAILNNTGDAIIVAGIDGTIRQTNPAFNTLSGYSEAELRQYSLINLMESGEIGRLAEMMQRIAGGEPACRFDIRVRRSDGSVFDADMTLAGIAGGENGIVDIVCSVRDMSARKQVEFQLRQTLEREKELNELKSRLIATVSHDFRTPLTVILSSTDTYRRYGDRMNDEQKDRHFARIQHGVEEITQLLEDVLHFSRGEAGQIGFQPALVMLDVLCRDVINSLPAQADRIEFSVSGNPGSIFADVALIRQIVMHLLSNALKYSPADRPVQFELICMDDRFVFRVSDQGIGIPEHDWPHLFEPFYRARNIGNISGSGLGLAIVKRAVELHGGTIAFESDEHGTTFTVTLPVPIEKKATP